MPGLLRCRLKFTPPRPWERACDLLGIWYQSKQQARTIYHGLLAWTPNQRRTVPWLCPGEGSLHFHTRDLVEFMVLLHHKWKTKHSMSPEKLDSHCAWKVPASECEIRNRTNTCCRSCRFKNIQALESWGPITALHIARITPKPSKIFSMEFPCLRKHIDCERWEPQSDL